MIPVTQPFLPSRKTVEKYLDGIYERKWLTNNGPLAQELKARLEEYLGVKNLLLVSNGTLALQVAYQALGIKNEAVTTPFSFVATASSLKWEGITPRFADIDPATFNLCPRQAELAMTEKTSVIVPVHVYGNPCNLEAFAELGKRHQVKVIYDAAHAFGVKYKGQSVLNWGDASTLSFHATKVFHTVEGGAIVFKDADAYERAAEIINFGLRNGTEIASLGINAKMSEVHAAFGLSVLDEVDNILEKRTAIYHHYVDSLKHFVNLPTWHSEASFNGAYIPILLESEQVLLRLVDVLKEHGIMARRYFYPSLNTVHALAESPEMSIAEDASRRVLCLPVFFDLELQSIEYVVELVKSVVNHS
ncbi:MAG: DegT/DnrJ/EryC1/StrS family aminotransferase [Pseudomonadota bacterium]|nr:DegT/DnrJ/EryC1/StrS family aminotransferase [Pseudomonadota bacterium]